MNNHQLERHYDLDWIKVYAMLLVFLYHCSMFFNSFEWHIKNNIMSASIEFFSLLIGNWIMPLFFVVSGIATFHALQKRNAQSYMRERLIRLGIPLSVGILLLSPPQVYIERIANNQYEGTYWQFYPHYFDGFYLEIGGAGNFAFFGHHLWYLLALLLFSLLTLPFFLKQREHAGKKAFGYGHYLFLLIPLIVAALTTNAIVNLGGWGLVFYFILYVYGYSFFTRGNMRAFIRRVGALAGFLSVLSMASYILWVMYIGFPMDISFSWAIFIIVRVIMVWNVLFYILYLGDKFLNVSNDVLKYTSEAAMPFYVLHQPIIIIIGFFIYNLEWGVLVKAAFLVSIAFTIIMIIYHFIIRRCNLLRVLFGLRRMDKEVSFIKRSPI